jgi:hypothetical protein
VTIMNASNVPDPMSAETFVVMKRRNRKGGRNDLVIRRAPAYVIGSHPADDGHEAGSDLASVVPHLAHALISERVARGRNGGGRSYDLSDLATAAYGLDPVIGGADIAYAQIIDAGRADIGADIADAAACCAHRDDIAGWASTANVRAAFKVSRESSRKLSWPIRTRVPVGRPRMGERDAVQARLQTVDGTHQVTAVYGPVLPDGRVFIGHRAIARSQTTRDYHKVADRTISEQFNVTTADQVEHMLAVIEPGKRATFRTPHYSGTITRSAKGRYSVRTTSGDVIANSVRTRTTVALAILAPR